MEYSSLPIEPQKRRAILILSGGDLRDLENNVSKDDTARRLLYNRQISLLNIDALSSETIESDSLIKTLSMSGDLFNAGNLLVQSPYNFQDYVEASKAYYSLARKKWDIFTYFWGFLGAKQASVKLEELKILSTNTKGSAQGGYSGIDAEFTVARDAKEKVKNEMNLTKNYRNQGHIMPDKAKEYIKQRQWLFSDYDFEGAIELCQAGIPLEKQEFSMTMTKESQTNLNLALSLQIPTSVTLNINFEQVKREIFNFSLTTTVEFW